MKYKLLLAIGLNLLAVNLLMAQKLVLKLDEDVIQPKTIFAYFPNYYQWQVHEGDKQYIILKGSASLVRNGKKVVIKSIANMSGTNNLFDKKLLPGAHLVVEVQQIGDPETRQTKDTNIQAAVLFNDKLKARPNPKCLLYLNNSTDYFYEGLNPQQLESVKFEALEEYAFEKMSIYHVRGVIPIQQNNYTNLQTAAEGLKGMIRDASVQTGDRLVLEISGKDVVVINVPIVE
ncbi:hypothetical protein [Cesiribacter sp. SM1]|uniref:hypothetical protein n=1 Tax=Cesiribacter sp. SM1 TaxID=2861196 RepID=UPI001CD3868D|nr:hypothetical protein [Cesiribacter sp. SM1]